MTLILSGTSGLSDVDGSAATPAIRGTDANTGIFFGADIIGFSEGGTEAMRIDSSGNVGIGTSSPDNKLELALADNQGINLEQTGSGQTGYINWRDSDGTLSGRISYDHGTDALRFNTSANERMRIDSSGNLLVGGTNNDPAGRTVPSRFVANGTTGVDSQTLFQTSNSYFNLVSAVNTTSGTRYHVTFRDGSTPTERGFISTNGSTTTYSTTSDYRLKENVQSMTGALATVLQLNPVTYTWKESGAEGQGFIAHELQAVVPDSVVGEKDAVNENGSIRPQAIDTSFLVATLTAALQEAHGLIKDLQSRVDALEAK